jgi:hypothetical protein
MKSSKKEQEAIEKAVGNATLKEAICTLRGLSDIEAVRAAHWQGLNHAARMVAVWQAGMPKERANDALKTFTAIERRKIMRAVTEFARQFDILKKCMQGGEVPDTTKPDFQQVAINNKTVH